MAGVVHGEPELGVLNSPTRLAVWGDPIAHSRSPRLHAAAYTALGLDWEYTRRRVSASDFSTALSSLDESWRGLSLTYPLKGRAFASAAWRDRRAQLTGAVNTLVRDPGGLRGFNTDVGGLIRVLQEHGVDHVDRARIVGAGATATSALVALAELGAQDIEVVARRVEAAAPLHALAAELGVTLHTVPLPEAPPAPVALTIATVPGEARIPDAALDLLAASGGRLLDAVYGTWPTPLALAWGRYGLPAHSGLGMLLHQALLQVRIFVTGDVDTQLPTESEVVAAMRGAVADA